MNTFHIIAVLTVLISSVYSAPASSVGNGVHPDALRESLNEALRSIKNCNSNICFALDGSGSVSNNDWRNATSFVQTVTQQVQLLPGLEKNAAAQFGKIAYPISLLTTNLEDFNIKIENAKFRGDSATSVGAGIVTCDAILALGTAQGPNKIVAITDGRNNFGGNPVANADIFRRRNPTNSVTAIGIGNVDENLLQQIAGPSGSVFTVEQYLDLFIIVNALVTEVCQG